MRHLQDLPHKARLVCSNSLEFFVMFESARLKIERADYHIADLKGQIEAFVSLKPHTFRIKHDEKTGQPSIQIKFEKPIPNTFSVT
jgi:hypothetical protein